MNEYLTANNDDNCNVIKEINDINNNISFFNKKNFSIKSSSIKKEIKKRTNYLRKCFNIDNTIFKEMQLKQNSLIYKELVKNLGKYFFGPTGIVTENYKFLRDYYLEKDSKIGLNNKIITGTLDYFSLLSNYDSYTQRLNSTKKQLLSASNNLAVANSGFDVIVQQAFDRNKFLKKNKNFVEINKKNVKNLYNNYNFSSSSINKNKDSKNIKHKIKFVDDEKYNNENNEFNKNSQSTTQDDKIFFKLIKINKNILKNNINRKNNQIHLKNDLSHKSNSSRETINERYSNEARIKELKQKINYMNSYSNLPNYLSSPLFQRKKSELNIKKINQELNIKERLGRRIKPIVFLNRNSIKDLSFIKNIHIKSKNYRASKKMVTKKNVDDVIFDELKNVSFINSTRLPSLQSITLSKQREHLRSRK